MTEPSAGPPGPRDKRPVPGPVVPPAGQKRRDGTAPEEGARFADLADRPVAEHVEVFEAEHDRLQSELGTIDRV